MANEIMFYQLSEEELYQKIKISFTDITCFFNKEVAEQAIHDNMKHHANEIAAWLLDESPNAGQRLRIVYKHTQPIGYGVSWRKKEMVENISHSYIILKKSKFKEDEEGFYIIFAAPYLIVGGHVS